MKILVIDDEEISRRMLTRYLENKEYEVLQAENGKKAIDILEKNPDTRIVIADWMMPEMDGPELCTHIRNTEEKYTYILLLTSKDEPEDIVKGFDAGADDYIVKPYNNTEISARIKVGERIICLEKNLTSEKKKAENLANEMEKLAGERANQLVHADRMATLGTLSAGIAHEVNNPATFISGNVQTFKNKFWPVIKNHIEQCSEEKPEYKKLKFITEETPALMDGIKNGAERISRIVRGLKSYARQEKPKSVMFDIHLIIEEALELCHNALKYNVTVEKELQEDIPEIKGDPQQIEQVFINLFNNAAHAMKDKKEGFLNISLKLQNGELFIKIKDTGTGINDIIIEKIWDPFFTTKSVKEGTGLGLSITVGIIENHGGKISAKNNPDGGAEFEIVLPIGN